MRNMLIYPAGCTAACECAASFMAQSGIPIIDHPAPEVTHLLLDVPSFGSDGKLRDGSDVCSLLERLPPDVTVVGGNLSHPALKSHNTMDLLQDAQYLSRNAAITADCALRVAAPLIPVTFSQIPVLVIGWGRIGKCLGKLLNAVDADVTIAARKESDRASILSLGYQTLEIGEIPGRLSDYRLIFNTVPALILHKQELDLCRKCVKIDLASKQGLEGGDVLLARGLPGIHTPESSGKLIAERFLKLAGRVL